MTADMPAARISRIHVLFLTIALLAAVGLYAAAIFGGARPASSLPVPAKRAIIAIPQPAPILEEGN